MSATLTVVQAGPALSIQDFGRTGYRAQGLTRGGAADPIALHEGAALLGQQAGAAIEMIGAGGTFTSDTDLRIALTGAAMTANIDGAAIVWNASHLLPAGAKLTIGGATGGTYGYLHIGGGLATPELMGSRSSHLSAGLGAALKSGDTLAIGPDKGSETGMALPRDNRFDGGTVHVVESMQTVEVIVQGDIQITGDGAPFVLMCESQTTGGYPRIATVLPADLPRIAQAPAGAAIRFAFVSLEEAIAIEKRAAAELTALPGKRYPLVRNPAEMRDLLSYQLIGGAVSANANPFEEGT